MGLKLSFFKIPRHSRFEYKPIYFDERKENLEKKIQDYKQKKELLEKGEYKPKFKGKFDSSFAKSNTKKNKKNANLRVVGIFVFISVLAFYIIKNNDLLSQMFNILLSGNK